MLNLPKTTPIEPVRVEGCETIASESIAIAKDKAGIAGKDHQLVVFPKEKTIFEALAEGMAGASVRGSTSTEAEMARILEAVELELSTPKAWLMTPEIEVH